MTIATLAEVLQPALKDGYAVAGLVCLGWEDTRAYVVAAEELGVPVILQAGPGCREHTPLSVLGKMFLTLAEQASVPVVAHLDHGYKLDECKEALDSGFTSLMYDGSRKPLQQNIEETATVVELARSGGISCEGEIGFVGYAEGEASAGTDPDEAAKFATETGIDAMAISVGNVHLQQQKSDGLNRKQVEAIQEKTNVPLVIHGGSGVPAAQRKEFAETTNICKYNVGTELRMAFGGALRDAIASDAEQFDRIKILQQTHEPVVRAARAVLETMRS